MATKTKPQNKETFEYKAEMKQLLKLIAHSLYTHPEVFIRELVSNSSDALNKLRFRKLTEKDILDPEKELKIEINVDPDKNTFSIYDSGIGMNKTDLVEEIGTVAKSGTFDFLEKVKENKGKIDGELIGQFGVGFYSVYMVTDKIDIKTRYYKKSSKSYKWTSSGEEKFEISPIDPQERGTKIYFKLKDEFKEFAQPENVKKILKKYSNFIEYPIYVNGEKINTVQAVWQKNKDDIKKEEANEFYKFISDDFKDPLDYIHLDIEGVVNFKSLIFFPKDAPANMFADDFQTTLHLYSNKVFIQNDAEWLLPEYLRFLKGVIDTSDLPLNVSREATQHSPHMTKIKNIITGKVLGELEKWAKNDKEKYNEFFEEFGTIIKTGLNSDFNNRDRLLELLRFKSSKRDELISFQDYIDNKKENQDKIYYLTAETLEAARRNPNLEYFSKNDIEVLFLTDPIDSFVIPQLGKYKDFDIISIDKADLDIDDKEDSDEKDEEKEDKLAEKIKEVLSDKVEDVKVSKRLVDSPCTLVIGKQGMDPQMEKMMRMMNKDFEGSKKVFEINTDHPILKNLRKQLLASGVNDKFRDVVNQLYESSLLMEGELKKPVDYVNRTYEMLKEYSK